MTLFIQIVGATVQRLCLVYLFQIPIGFKILSVRKELRQEKTLLDIKLVAQVSLFVINLELRSLFLGDSSHLTFIVKVFKLIDNSMRTAR